MNGMKMLKKLNELLLVEVEKREVLLNGDFKTNLRFDLGGKKRIINSMWTVLGNTYESVESSYKVKSKDILSYATELKSLSLANEQVAKDFGVDVECTSSGYYEDLIKAHKILEINLKIRKIEIDIEVTDSQLVDESDKKAALMKDIMSRNQME